MKKVMAKTKVEEFESKLSLVEKLLKLIWGLLFAGFVLGGWVTTIELRTQANCKTVVTHIEKLNNLELWKATTENSKWTIQQQNENDKVRSELQNLNDKRLQRLEDNWILVGKQFDEIKKSVERIEVKIGSKQ